MILPLYKKWSRLLGVWGQKRKTLALQHWTILIVDELAHWTMASNEFSLPFLLRTLQPKICALNWYFLAKTVPKVCMVSKETFILINQGNITIKLSFQLTRSRTELTIYRKKSIDVMKNASQIIDTKKHTSARVVIIQTAVTQDKIPILSVF